MYRLITTTKYEQVGNITCVFTVEGTGFQSVILGHQANEPGLGQGNQC